MANDPPLIERPIVCTPSDLSALTKDLRAAGRFALDTEFLGERTYVPKLCLVQVATKDFIALVDTIAVKDISPLWELISDNTIEKVLHAAREDLRLAYYGGGKLEPRNIFDTQVAGGLVGLPQYPLSYGRLVDALIGVKLSKAETRSEWDRRPLTPEQFRYARDDVRYLLPVADKLSNVLTRLGRIEWMNEEMSRFSDPAVYEPDPEIAYLRVRGPRAGLTARPTALLRAVAAWREREAADRDVPARTILRDEALTELALRGPRHLTEFIKLRNFPAGEETTLGPGILAALNAGRTLNEGDLPVALVGQDEDTPQQRTLADLVCAIGSAICLETNIAPELAITKTSSSDLTRGDLSSPLLTGWRYSALGNTLQAFAAGSSPISLEVIDGVLKVAS